MSCSIIAGLVFVQLKCLYKFKSWLNISSKLKAVDDADADTYFLLVCVLFFNISIGFLNLVTIKSRLVFFTNNETALLAFEYFNCSCLLTAFAFRNQSTKRVLVTLAVSWLCTCL